jgi:capsular polysaccharide biosynthesis protein
MKSSPEVTHNTNFQSLDEFLELILNKKFFLIYFTLSGLLISSFYSLILPNIYTSEAILAPTKNIQSSSSLLSSYSALGNLAGINLSRDDSNQSIEAIERMKSLDFFSDEIYPFINIHDLLAVKKWDSEKDIIIYDNNLYDDVNNKWLKYAAHSNANIPSQQESYDKFIDIFSVNEDLNTGFVKISISHESPYIAKTWLELIIKNINEKMKKVDRNLAINSINFLSDQLMQNKLAALNDATSKLLESQMQILMKTSVNDAYIYKVISSPVVPEKKSSPNRILIIVFGFFISFFLAVLLIVIKFNIYRNPIEKLKE